MTSYVMSTDRALRRILVYFVSTCCTDNRLGRIVFHFAQAIQFIWILIVPQIIRVFKINHRKFFACGGAVELIDSKIEFLHLNSPAYNKKAASNQHKIRQGGRM